jgi:ribonuclease BN (tRNA processing enzyme)
MKTLIWTWGTGGAFGRELGGQASFDRKRRDHSAISVIGSQNDEIDFHLMVDAGAPCVEKMIDQKITNPPDILFITHTHNDHVSDFDKLVNSRKRGLAQKSIYNSPLSVVCSSDCANHKTLGLKTKFEYLLPSVEIFTIKPDVWYSIQPKMGKPVKADITLPTAPVECKMLPVNHAAHAPGACLYIFKFKRNQKKLVVTGDFDTLDASIIHHKDLMNPDAIIIDTNTLIAENTGHSNWEKNKKLLNGWLSFASNHIHVLLTHLSGYEDHPFYKRIPTDQDWQNAIEKFTTPQNMTIEIAEDGKSYEL